MMGRLSSRDKKLFAEAVAAIGNNDIAKLTDFALKIGVYKEKISYSALSGDIETNPDINFIQIMIDYMSDDYIKSFDLKNELKLILKSLNFSFRKSLDIPAQISNMLKMFFYRHAPQARP